MMPVTTWTMNVKNVRPPKQCSQVICRGTGWSMTRVATGRSFRRSSMNSLVPANTDVLLQVVIRSNWSLTSNSFPTKSTSFSTLYS